ncbi:hypothetical protein EB796_022598 [Bugula neritina]|uniref:Uncharacterized protein n=1 Tax=Bugula neritina TaxID=10212 RepID=A0A7J7J0A0_BUGNE|nr:hypothetical protein EB796_022598 [Bugula neritina]
MVFDDEMMAREAAKVLAAIQEEVDGSMFITLTYCNSMLVLHCDQTLDRLLPPASAGVKQDFKKPRASLLPPPSSKLKAATEKGTSKSQNLLQTRLEEMTRLCDDKDVYSRGLKSELLSACRSVESLGVVIQCLSRVVEEQNVKLGKARESQQLMVKSHEEELTNQTTELELLTQNYEQEKQVCLSVSVYFCLSVCLSIGGGRGGCASYYHTSEEVVRQLTEAKEREMRQLQAGHDEELEKMKERLTAEHNQYIDSLRNEHCTQIDTLNKEVKRLAAECDSWQVKFYEATEALHQDMDHRLQVALQPYKNLPMEIESLKAVIELKSHENKELRIENNHHKQKVERIPDLEKQLYDTKQKLENLQALLDIVSAKEKETAEKYHKVTRQAVQEKKENHRLSLNMEALALKLEEVEFSQSIHNDTLNGW